MWSRSAYTKDKTGEQGPVIRLIQFNAWLVYPTENITCDASIDPFRIELLYPRLLQTVKLNEELASKAEELKGKTTARGTHMSREQYKVGLGSSMARSQTLWSVARHRKSSDTRGRGPKHKKKTFQKQVHLHHEAHRVTQPVKSRLCMRLKTKFGEAFSFSSGSNE